MHAPKNPAGSELKAGRPSASEAAFPLVWIGPTRAPRGIGALIRGIFRDRLEIGNALIELFGSTAHHDAAGIPHVETEKNLLPVTADPVTFQSGNLAHVWWQIRHVLFLVHFIAGFDRRCLIDFLFDLKKEELTPSLLDRHQPHLIGQAIGGHRISVRRHIHVAHDVAAAGDRPALEFFCSRIEAYDGVRFGAGFVVPEPPLVKTMP